MSGLGPVSISGTVNTKAENALLATPGLLYADLVISTPKGQINVHVTPGTIGLNPFAQPVHMQYALAGGTGAFHLRHRRRSGRRQPLPGNPVQPRPPSSKWGSRSIR